MGQCRKCQGACHAWKTVFAVVPVPFWIIVFVVVVVAAAAFVFYDWQNKPCDCPKDAGLCPDLPLTTTVWTTFGAPPTADGGPEVEHVPCATEEVPPFYPPSSADYNVR